MQALTRAESIEPVLDHLRGLVTLMRSHDIALDYARLASDIAAVQHPVGRRGVRVRWSRDFYRPPKQPENATTPSGDDA